MMLVSLSWRLETLAWLRPKITKTTIRGFMWHSNFPKSLGVTARVLATTPRKTTSQKLVFTLHFVFVQMKQTRRDLFISELLRCFFVFVGRSFIFDLKMVNGVYQTLKALNNTRQHSFIHTHIRTLKAEALCANLLIRSGYGFSFLLKDTSSSH